MDGGPSLRYLWEDAEGACYLRLVRPESRPLVLWTYGMWPTVGKLLSMPASCFLDLDRERFCLGVRGAVCHVLPRGYVDGKRFCSLLAALVNAAKKNVWLVGSLGHALQHGPYVGLISDNDLSRASDLSLSWVVGASGMVRVVGRSGDILVGSGFSWEDQNGACYLRLIREEWRSIALWAFGLWPRFEDLLFGPFYWFVELNSMRKLVANCTGESVVHVEDSMGQSGVVAMDIVVACLARDREWPMGTMGYVAMLDDDLQNYVENAGEYADCFIDLSWTIGGFSVEQYSYPKELPRTERVVEAYYLALICGAFSHVLGSGVDSRDSDLFDRVVGRVKGSLMIESSGDHSDGKFSMDGVAVSTRSENKNEVEKKKKEKTPKIMEAVEKEKIFEGESVSSFGGFVVTPDSVRGVNYARNKASRDRKKKNKLLRADKMERMAKGNWRDKSSFPLVVEESLNKEPSALRASLEEKWKAENELAALKARRQLEVLRANDVKEEVRRYRTRVCADTEKSMVSIERTHNELKATGNAPEGGFAETVVSGSGGVSSGSISPNSSASVAEFRAVQKQNADLQHIVDRYRELAGPLEAYEYRDKSVWTMNSTNDRILDEIFPEGCAYDFETAPPGKFRVVCGV